MTSFGIIWMVIVIFCLMMNDIRYMLFITLLFMTFQSTNVLYLNGTGIGPGVLTSLLFVLKTFLCRGRWFRYYKKDIFILLTMFLLFGIIVFSTIRNGIFIQKNILILQLLSYILCFMCINVMKNKINKNEVYQMIRIIIIFLALFGIVQILTTTEVLPIRPVLNLIFYNDPSTDIVFHKYNYPRIMSTFMEPSYYAGFVVGAFYYLLGFREKWKSNAWILIILIIEIIMTKSSTAYGAFLIVGILFILSAKINIKWRLMGIVLALAGAFIIYFGFYNILDEVIFSKDLTGSYSTRENMNNEAIEAFKSSILYGVGYKNSRGSSIVYSLLAQIGIIGFVLYMIISIGVSLHLLKSNGISFAVLSAVVCQIIACPDLDLCTYWFWLYCAGTIIIKREIETKYIEEGE